MANAYGKELSRNSSTLQDFTLYRGTFLGALAFLCSLSLSIALGQLPEPWTLFPGVGKEPGNDRVLPGLLVSEGADLKSPGLRRKPAGSCPVQGVAVLRQLRW